MFLRESNIGRRKENNEHYSFENSTVLHELIFR
jgi:hypothetical protein